MATTQPIYDHFTNPVDMVEHIATIHDWTFERSAPDELTLTVSGSWCDYHISLSWRDDLEALHLACAFDFRVPKRRLPEIYRLLALVNEQLWLGHFDLWKEDGLLLYRHGLLLAGADTHVGQCEALLKAALEACERYYQSFQFVLWAGKSPEDALAATMLLVGAGKMGGALLEGWLRQGLDPASVFIQDPAPPPEVADLAARHGIAASAAPDLPGAPSVILLAVKPDLTQKLLPEIEPLIGERTVLLSIAAGRTLANLALHLPAGTAIVRAIECAMLLEAVGEVVWLEDESLLDAVTAVSGSGPAYVFLLAECLAEAGRAAGLDPELARRLARATVEGAGELLRRSDLSPAELREKVTSPKGTTAAALEVLMGKEGVQDLINRAVAAAAKRSREISS